MISPFFASTEGTMITIKENNYFLCISKLLKFVTIVKKKKFFFIVYFFVVQYCIFKILFVMVFVDFLFKIWVQLCAPPSHSRPKYACFGEKNLQMLNRFFIQYDGLSDVIFIVDNAGSFKYFCLRAYHKVLKYPRISLQTMCLSELKH